MQRFAKWIVCAVLVLGFTASVCQCGDFRVVGGTVKTLDKFHSNIVVRWLADPRLPRYEEVVLNLTKNTKVIRGSRPATVNDINVGETVTVKFESKGAEFPDAVLIMVNS